MTVKPDDENRAYDVISIFVDRIVASAAFSELTESQRTEAERVLGSFRNFSQEFEKQQFVQISTEHALSTEMKFAIEDAIEEVPLPWGTSPLFRLPAHH
ncbi:hypothetical protein [Octadecabacter ascidiaceicola]|uniref:Uncharacterized protein n=1 Tax=Octadecabacter ascidiaceicola TaxID=1655543 RepID=A0A238K2L8_9RHOB|nr:hypothetical protein [Octadecabacter ascidiaceicola]SMX37151.1 hypothetical protein OCA8868_01299 [Octadecabacter ascidiaceicola]